jgi:tetratricopeptide (TPR) repeat protein
MLPEDGARIIEHVGEGRYEDALGVPVGAGRERVNRMHVRLLHRFRDHPEVREALNRAKCRIATESDAGKGRRLYRLGLHGDALPWLERAVRTRGDLTDLHWLGTALFGLERYPEAIPVLARAVEVGHDVLDEEMLEASRRMVRTAGGRNLRQLVAGLVASVVAALARGPHLT